MKPWCLLPLECLAIAAWATNDISIGVTEGLIKATQAGRSRIINLTREKLYGLGFV